MSININICRNVITLNLVHPAPGNVMLVSPGVGEVCQEVVLQPEVGLRAVLGPQRDHRHERVVASIEIEIVCRP